MATFSNRRWLAVTMCLLSVVLPITVRAQGLGDLNGHWAERVIRQGVTAGYVAGYPDGTFRPDAHLTRAEAVKLVQGALGLSRYASTDGAGILRDVDRNHWLIQGGYGDPAVLKVVATLWAAGPGDVPTTYQRVTRGELAALVARLHDGDLAPDAIVASGVSSVPDLAAWNHPAKLWVLQAAARGVLSGFPDGTFRPDEPVTRAQAVTLLERVRAMPAAPARRKGEGASLLAASDLAVRLRTPEGGVRSWHRYMPQVPDWLRAFALAEGVNHSLALAGDGTVWAWGTNEIGQLGDKSLRSHETPARVHSLENIVAVAAGDRFSLALRADGTVWAWGAGQCGQLGTGEQHNAWGPLPTRELTDAVAISAGYLSALALRKDGTVYEWGAVRDGTGYQCVTKPVKKQGLQNVTAISAGEDVSLALLADGTVQAWSTYHWPTKAGTAADWPSTPTLVEGLSGVVDVAAGTGAALALKRDGTVWAWGNNREGQLGDGSVVDAWRPVRVTGLQNVRAIALDRYVGVALTAEGKVYGWGVGGPLPDFDTANPAPLPALPGVVALAVGGEQAIALTETGQLYGWGEGHNGANGTHFRTTMGPVVNVPPAALVAAGDHHTLALTLDGVVWMWGVAERDPQSSWLNPKGAVEGLTQVSHIAAGTEHSLAVTTPGGAVWAWGRNDRGQMGDVVPKDRFSVMRVPGLAGVTTVAAGTCHSLGLDASGAVWAWGCNDDGQLGDTAAKERRAPEVVGGLPPVRSIAAAANLSLALDTQGYLWAWGAGLGGKPVQLSELAALVSMGGSAGGAWAQGVDGTVWIWTAAQTADLLEKAGAARHTVPGWKGARAVAASATRAVALLPHGTLETFGADAYRLGLVHATPVLLPNQ